ncbi:DUF262 domain-containing protein [Euryarchaeota archaeon]|nr:DUF262 domain-containing protein [Euryarchaeota archaeon]
MSYEIRSDSAQAIIKDRSIVLPRFQRKKSWLDVKNYQLCVSLFKNYPLGVMVMKKEVHQGTNSRILLDGRQRKNVLENMQNPENIYKWAKKTLGIKNADDPETISSKFWQHLDNYIGDTKLEREEREEEEETFDYDDENYSKEYNSENENNDLSSLLEIIKTVHKPSGWRNGFTRPFEFQEQYSNLPFFWENPDNGKQEIRSDELCRWIRYQLDGDGSDEISKEKFFEWLERSGQKKESVMENTVKNRLLQKWPGISASITIIKNLDSILSERKAGYVYLTGGTMADAMKIFEIINTQGEPLTPTEILSAKFTWNKKIENPHEFLSRDAENLYVNELGIVQDADLVRWDRAATFINRIEENWIFGNLMGDSKTEFEKRVTLGFKLMSGYYLNSISKIKMETLADLDDIPWGAIDLEKKINTVIEKIRNEEFFQFVNSWDDSYGFSIKSIMSEAISINFLLLMVKDWENKDEPVNTNSGAQKKFRKNAIILFDRLIYEYLMGRWKGSSDSRITRNLENMNYDSNGLFIPIENEAWKRLIDDVVEKGEINGESYLQDSQGKKVAKILLWYYYSLGNKAGPNKNDPTIRGIDIEHIIPQDAFATTTGNAKDLMNNIVNLSFFPKKLNQSKNSRPLNIISSENEPWLVEQIKTYSEISKDKFNDFYKDVHVVKLSDERGEKIKNVLIQKRNQLID